LYFPRKPTIQHVTIVYAFRTSLTRTKFAYDYSGNIEMFVRPWGHLRFLVTFILNLWNLFLHVINNFKSYFNISTSIILQVMAKWRHMEAVRSDGHLQEGRGHLIL